MKHDDPVSLAAAGAAHDALNLLSAVRGALASAREGRGDGALMAAALEACTGAEALMARLMTLSDPVPEPAEGCCGDEELAAVLPLLVSCAGEGIALSARLEGGEGVIAMDRAELVALVMNLLMNSRRAMEGRGRFALSTRCRDGFWELRAWDSGPGVAPELRERIFAPGYSHRRGGHGLGLPRCRAMAAAAGGTLRCGPCREGALFVLRLPAEAPPLPGEELVMGSGPVMLALAPERMGPFGARVRALGYRPRALEDPASACGPVLLEPGGGREALLAELPANCPVLLLGEGEDPGDRPRLPLWAPLTRLAAALGAMAGEIPQENG